MIDQNIEVIKFTEQTIAEAVAGLDRLQAILVPFFKKLNHKGCGERDARQFKHHLAMAKTALIILNENLDTGRILS